MTTRVLFLGRKAVAAKSLEYLLSREGVEVVGVLTNSDLDGAPTRDLASRHNLRLYEYLEALAALKSKELYFDIGFSVLYWRRLREEYLTVPPRGIINFHPAPLPAYKGTAGYNIAIMKGLDEWAVTAHYIDEEIDTGGIIDMVTFSIVSEYMTAQSLERKTMPVLFDLFKRTADSALASVACLHTTPNVGGIYITRREMEDMKIVKPGDDLDRKVRAFWFPPHDGANIIINGKRYTLVNSFILRQLGETGSVNEYTK